MLCRSKFAAHFHKKTLLIFLKLKSFHTKNVILFFFLLPVDITAAVAPDKLIPSLSICVVPLSPSGEERGEGGAGVSCSGKVFFCFEKKKNKVFNVFQVVCQTFPLSFIILLSACSSVLQQYYMLQR